jgi:DNA-binding NtrC family response regulator
MIGQSAAIDQVLKTVQSVLNYNLPILITGETGTGKELVARVLHYSGKRQKGPFVAVNCAAFTRELLESELFGHEKGAFTGAIQQKKGVFEQAQDGTLMLDEIGEMPLEMQAKLLRVLQGGEFRRIGGVQTLSTNARVILATNRNLEEMVSLGTFREDLFYRIKVVEIPIPPLRNRVEDIPLLANAFLKQVMLGSGKTFHGFTQEALEIFKQYSWPGNVRQLRSEVERLVALTDDGWIDVHHLDPRILRAVQPKNKMKTEMIGSLLEIEKRLILDRLNEHNWSVILAAKSLGITRHGLYSKMKRYSISSPKK